MTTLARRNAQLKQLLPDSEEFWSDIKQILAKFGLTKSNISNPDTTKSKLATIANDKIW